MNEIDREEYEALKIKLNDIRNEIYTLENLLVSLRSYMNDAAIINDDICGDDVFSFSKDTYQQVGDNITYNIIPKINSDMESI